MKFTKPTYDAKQKMYFCDVTDGVRFSVRRECGSFVQSLDSCINSDERISHLVETTKGWFSKPLTSEFLKGKIHYDIPTGDIPETFEGCIEWEIRRLVISKERFLFVYAITQLLEDEKVSLEFPDESVPQENEPEEEIAMNSEEEIIGIGPTRRKLEKDKVMSARRKAARALFNAERLTQEYYSQFGETDWEDSSEED
jgi:hypothetical protein